MNLSEKLAIQDEQKMSLAKDNLLLRDENSHLKLENRNLREEVEVLQDDRETMMTDWVCLNAETERYIKQNRFLKAALALALTIIIVLITALIL